MKQVKKKIVCFDTSCIRSKSNVLDAKYPECEWVHSATEPTDLELRDAGKNAADESYRNSAFRRALSMRPLLPRGEVLLKEVEAYVNGSKLSNKFILCDITIQESRKNLIKEDNKKAILKIQERIKNMGFWENYYWKIIKIVNDNTKTNISFNEILSYLDNICRENRPVYINNIDITKLYCSNPEEFMKSCPACYNYILLLCFLEILKKPKDSID